MNQRNNSKEGGFALITVLLLLALLVTLIVAYFNLTRIEISTTKSSMNSVKGLYASEAGLNVRADLVRQIFQGYNRPTGTSPTTPDPCTTGNMGTGDFACVGYDLQDRDVSTYLTEAPGNPSAIVIPRGEQFQNLSAQEYEYLVDSVAYGHEDRPEAVLKMQFKSRLVPMFQFAAFYNKDLEILPGPAMQLEGPVHTNGDLYLDSGAGLDILGQVSTAESLYQGRKNDNTCTNGGVAIIDPGTLTPLASCSGGTTQMSQPYLDAWNGMIETGVDVLTVPPPEALDPIPGEIYWDRAEIRIVLNVATTPPSIEVRDPDGTVNAIDTAILDGCDAASYTDEFYNNREGTAIEMLDVDAEDLLNCMESTTLLGAKTLADTSEGGLVWYLTVDGPDSAVINNYGVRVSNGEDLQSTNAGAPEIRGLTVVTNQAMYVQGNYNSTDKKPAAFLADSINILSEGWDADADSTEALSHANRKAEDTEINAAFLGGTDTTGGVEGSPQFGGAYNGGLENYPRFHEDWSGETLTYRGSFVSLNNPLHVDGPWVYGGTQYTAPDRDWHYDTDFNDANNLPPLSPRFVYLKQELFMRQFEM